MGSKKPYLEILEQPQQRGMRFRYACEGRAAGSILAQNSDCERKAWPSCQIYNYVGPAVMRVSLITKDDPPKPHPHSLVGRDCDKGVCTINVDPSHQMLGVFSNLGIQCVRRREVRKAIEDRLNQNVNPFRINRSVELVDVDLNVVRLCFEAFIPDDKQNYSIRLPPVVSNCIYDKKATCSSILKICRVDKLYGKSSGNEQVFLLCDKVQKEDIEIVFFEDGWEACGEFCLFDVHRQVAIVFKTPPYRDTSIQRPVCVHFHLRRPSDRERSQSIEFFYLPEQHARLLEREKTRVIRRHIPDISS